MLTERPSHSYLLPEFLRLVSTGPNINDLSSLVYFYLTELMSHCYSLGLLNNAKLSEITQLICLI